MSNKSTAKNGYEMTLMAEIEFKPGMSNVEKMKTLIDVNKFVLDYFLDYLDKKGKILNFPGITINSPSNEGIGKDRFAVTVIAGLGTKGDGAISTIKPPAPGPGGQSKSFPSLNKLNFK